MTSQLPDKSYGIVKCYFPLKGYGFITREKGKDLFFFYKDLDKESGILEGARVAFLIQDCDKGPRAISITRVG